jgi:RNA polymerase sigma-70 factor (TIGR02960 family)
VDVSDATLARARKGDEQAFRRLTDPHRRELHLHCYRLLGSVQDAEDALQETLIAAWRGLPGFREQATARTWLYRIATNQCLNMLRARGRRPPPAPAPPFDPPEPTRQSDVTWLQPYPCSEPGHGGAVAGPEAVLESAEGIELAFIVALQRMPPRQAAALVLSDVLGFPVDDVAAMLGASRPSVKGLLQRARAAARGTSQDAPGSAASASAASASAASASGVRASERAVSRRFADAYAADDIDGVVALLTDDAWLSMPPAPHEYQGGALIGSFLRASAAWRAGRRFVLVPACANGQPAFGCYLESPGQPQAAGERCADAAGLIVLGLAGGQIMSITRFLDPEVFRFLGLPATVPAPRRP